MPNYLKLFEPVGKAAEKGLAKVGIKITGEKVSTTGTKALAKMAEEGKGSFVKLAEKRGVSAAKFGQQAASKSTREVANRMAREAGQTVTHVGHYGAKAAAKAGRQVLRPTVSVAERGTSIATRKVSGLVNRTVNQATHAMRVPPMNMTMRYSQHVERLLAKMNPVQRFFYNFQVQMNQMLSRLFGINTDFMYGQANRLGRLVYGDARFSHYTGDSFSFANSVKGAIHTAERASSFAHNSRLINEAEIAVERNFLHDYHVGLDLSGGLTKKQLRAVSERATEKAAENATSLTAKEGTEKLVKASVREGTEQVVNQEGKKATQQAADRVLKTGNNHFGVASPSKVGSLTTRYDSYVQYVMAHKNPVQRFFYNSRKSAETFLSDTFGINGHWMKGQADRMGRMVFGDAKIAAESELKAGEKLTEGAIKDSLKKSLEDTTKHLETRIRVRGGNGGQALADIAKQSVGKSYERLTGEELFTSASKTGEKAGEEIVSHTVKEGAESLGKDGAKEGLEQAARQEAKKETEVVVEHAAEDTATHSAEQGIVHTGEEVVADGGKKAADTIVHEWKNVAKEDLKVGDRIRLVNKSGEPLSRSEVVIKDIKDGKFTVESVERSGLIPNQTFEKQAIQRLEESTEKQLIKDAANSGVETATGTVAKESVLDGAKESAENLEKKVTNGSLFDLTENFQKKMNEAETFQWKVNKMMDKSLAKQKEAIDKLYEAAKVETNPSSAAKMLSEATEKETALSLKIAENLQKQKELIEGVDRRVAQEAELAARKETEKAAEKANPFELPEKLMNRLKSRPKEFAQWNMNKAAWEGLQEQRRAVDKLYEAAAKTTNLRESAKLTSEAAEKSAALQKQAAEIMQSHVELAGRLNKTLFRQGAEKIVQNPKQLLGWSGAILGSGMAVSGIASGKGALDPFFRTLFGQQYEQNGLGGVLVKTAIGEKNQKAAAEKLSQLGEKTGNAVAESVPKVANEVGRVYNGVANDVSAINSEAGNVYNNVKDVASGLYHGNQQISDGNGGYYDSTTQQYEGVPQDGSSSQYAMGLARNAMNSVSGGNVSKMDLGTLLGASILGFGRFGLFGKAIGAAMAGSAIHNINKRGQSTQQVQQTQGYNPSQSQPVIQTQEYKASTYRHPEVSFDDEGNVQHSRHM